MGRPEPACALRTERKNIELVASRCPACSKSSTKAVSRGAAGLPAPSERQHREARARAAAGAAAERQPGVDVGRVGAEEALWGEGAGIGEAVLAAVDRPMEAGLLHQFVSERLASSSRVEEIADTCFGLHVCDVADLAGPPGVRACSGLGGGDEPAAASRGAAVTLNPGSLRRRAAAARPPGDDRA